MWLQAYVDSLPFTMKICVIVTAAGGSTRYLASGGARSKLEEDLGGRTVLLRAIEAFTLRNEVDSIIVVAPQSDDEFDTFQLRQGTQLAFHGVTICRGGPTRTDSVRNALALVPDQTTHIAVHDGARPLVSEVLLDRIFDAAKSRHAVIPAIPVSDTLKRVQKDEAAPEADPLDDILGTAGKLNDSFDQVIETVDRASLVAVQTPQVFERTLLERAYASAVSATDDAALVEALGEPVSVVEGEPTNIKVTTSADIVVARALLSGNARAKRPASERF